MATRASAARSKRKLQIREIPAIIDSTRPLQPLLARLDKQLVHFIAAHSTGLTLIALATVFIWFGLLKLTGLGTAFDLVAKTVYWFPVPAQFFVPFLGLLEIGLGIGLLFSAGMLLRLILFGFLLHMAGTFLVLGLQPGVAFLQGNPFRLTTEGEYVVKNLVLIAAGLVVLANSARSEEEA